MARTSSLADATVKLMETLARQVRTWQTRLLAWGWCAAMAIVGSPVHAQPADSPARLGPILIDPASSQQSDEPDGPFIADPSSAPLFPEPLEPVEAGPAEFPPGAVDRAWEAPPVRNAPLGNNCKLPPNYWVVSFRDCPQAGSPCTADKCTQYFYFGPNGPGTRRNPGDFYSSLRPDVPVCMMVHGSLIEWKQMLAEGHETYEWLSRAQPGVPFQMVFVTWPSDRPLALVAPIDFSILGKRSSYNGLYLARVLSKFPSDMSVSLIGHSHGARLAVSALNLIGGGDAYGYRLEPRSTPWPRLRVVTAAAAMNHDWFNPDQRYGRALTNTESILNLRNQNDFALRLYAFRPLGGESLGRIGFTRFDQRTLGPNYAKIRDVEASSVLGTRHVWPWFYTQPALARTLTPYLFFQDDVPQTLTLKPEPRWPFNSQPKQVRSYVPSQVQRTSDSGISPQPRVVQPPPRATVTPSAVRAYGRTQSP